MDSDVGTFVGLEDAAAEVGKICSAYRDEDVDLTILLTHIGYESDKLLAAMLDPQWGVDMIIGGHSHTVLEQPTEVNGILIVQAGMGTDQVGRFDVVVDDDTNSIVESKWQLIPVDDDLAEPDAQLRSFIDSFQDEIDTRYNSIITRFPRQLTHPRRTEETSLGNLFADVIAERAGADVVLVGSGSIRAKALGPVVTLGDLYSAFPYDDALHRFTINGAQLKHIFGHIMRPENRNSEGECYQVNHGVQAVYDDARRALASLDLDGRPVMDTDHYTLAMQGYHFKSSADNLGITQTELRESGRSTLVTPSVRDVVEEYMRSWQNHNSQVEGRLVYRVVHVARDGSSGMVV
jgi:5'-nucleotidase/UDP-sugar diphosphatase